MKNFTKKLILAFGTLFIATSYNTTKAQAGAALNFDGSNDIVNLPSAITGGLGNSQVLTVEAWVRPTTTFSGSIVSNHLGGATQFALRQQGNRYDFFVGLGAHQIFSPVGSATINTWQHVAGVFNGTSIKLYINGALVTTSTITSYSLPMSMNLCYIGNNGYSEAFTGDIDEVRIWRRALCDAEIQNNFNGQLSSPQNNLFAYYQFNQGLGGQPNPAVSTLNDSGPFNYNGNLVSFALNGATSNWVAPGGVVSGSLAPAFGATISAINPTTATICSLNPLPVTFTANGSATNYTWLPSNTNSNTITVTPTVTTSYTLIATNSVTGCSALRVFSVNSVGPPSVSVNSGSICLGNSFTMNPLGAASYTFQGGNAVVSPTANSNYTILGASFGCTAQATSSVTVLALPLPTVTAVTNVTNVLCVGQTATLTASGANTYVWNTTATTAVIAVSPTTTTSYTVIGTNSLGCTNSATITQNVTTCAGLFSLNQTESILEIFPNPSNGEFNLKLSNEVSIEVFNMLGSFILSTKMQSGNYKLDLREHPKGMYILKCSSNGQIKSYRLIKD